MTDESLHVRLRDGVTLRVEVRGEGFPILLLHGFGGSAESWGEAALIGLARSHRLIVPDLPGHGRSDAPADPARYAMPRLIEDLAYVLGELAAPRAHWIGYSMGGRVALGAAVLAPEWVVRLVLEGASPGLESEEERRARREQDESFARKLETEGIRAWAEAWSELPLFASQRRLPEPVREALRERRLRNDPHALAACLRGLGTGAQPSFWDRLGEIRAPTLLLTGEEDRKFTGIAARMARAIPEAAAVSVPGAGHAVHLESPEPWLEAVESWLV